MLSIGRRQTTITAEVAILQGLQAEFAETSTIVLRHALDAELLHLVRQSVSRGQFATKVHADSGSEQCMEADAAVATLQFLLGAPEVLRFMETVTTERPLHRCLVRIYRLDPETGERHDWHDDVSDGRRLGLSLNLGMDEFAGGNLQLRDSTSHRALADVRNTGAGDLVVFRLRADIQHQVLPVTGAFPRTVLAGWFRE